MVSPVAAFVVRPRSPELITPATPTPRELKLLSDIDNQKGNRFQISVLQFFRRNRSNFSRDPVSVIREGLARALVYYYPFAGRLREMAEGGKLAVDCTGDGLLFVEADADNGRIDDFGEPPVAPPECAAELLREIQGTDGIVGTPLLLIQVTRMSCGGVVVGIRINHAFSDGSGVAKFLTVAGELAQGLRSPSIHPVWARELLSARNPPNVTRAHHEYDAVPIIDPRCALPPIEELERRYIFFNHSEMSNLRSRLPLHLCNSCSSFEIITACNWRCRNIALALHPAQEVRATFTNTAHGKSKLNLPRGYYGNSFSMPTAVSTAGELCSKPLGYAVELIRQAKNSVDAEYFQSVADLMVQQGRPQHCLVHTYFASDSSRVGFQNVDFGFGKPVYACQVLAKRSSFYVMAKNSKGEEGFLVSVCLPSEYMGRFLEELEKITKTPADQGPRSTSSFHSLL